MDKDQEIKLLKELVMIQYILAKNITTDVGFSDEVKDQLYDKIFFYMDNVAEHLTENGLKISSSMDNEILEWMNAHDEEDKKIIFDNYHALVESDEFKELMKK